VHDAAQDLPFLADELRVDPLALGIADLLQDHLLGGLRRDAAQILKRLFLQQLQLDIQLGLGVQGLGVREADLGLGVTDLLDDLLAMIDAELAGLAVDVDADIVPGPERFP